MPPNNSRNVVVVLEDDQGLRTAMDRVLMMAGYRTHAYNSGEDLLESGAAGEADCLVLDVKLPGMSGFEVQERLVALGLARPVVFITAFDEPVTRGRAVAAGASSYLTKPFLGSTLIDAVRSAIAAPKARLSA